MGYLGNPVTKDFTATTSAQTLTGDGSTAYALSKSVAVPEDIAVLRNGVRQKPTPPNTPCLLYTSPSPRDRTRSRMPSSA